MESFESLDNELEKNPLIILLLHLYMCTLHHI